MKEIKNGRLKYRELSLNELRLRQEIQTATKP